MNSALPAPINVEPAAAPRADQPPLRRLLMIRAYLYMLLIDCRLTFSDFESVYAWLEAATARQRQCPASDALTARRVIDEVCVAIQRASRYYYRSRKHCLPSALLAYWLMRREGLAVEFCLGVKKYPFRAHAWVEYDGRVVFTTSADLPTYTVILRS